MKMPALVWKKAQTYIKVEVDESEIQFKRG